MLLPGELLLKISQFCTLQTYYRLTQCSRVLHSLLIPSNNYFSPIQLVEAMAERDADRVERWMKTEHFQSSVFSAQSASSHIHTSVQKLFYFACRYGLISIMKLLLADARMERVSDQYWGFGWLSCPDEDATYDIFLMYYSRYPQNIEMIATDVVENHHNRILDVLMDRHLDELQVVHLLGWAVAFENKYAVFRIRRLNNYEDILREYYYFETTGMLPKTVEMIEFMMEGKDYSNYDLSYMICHAFHENNPDLGRFLFRHMDFTGKLHSVRCACIHGYFDLVREYLKQSDSTEMQDLLQKSDFEIFHHFFDVATHCRDDTRHGPGVRCVPSYKIVDYVISKGVTVVDVLLTTLLSGSLDVIQHLLSMEIEDIAKWRYTLLYRARSRRDLQILSLVMNDPRLEWQLSDVSVCLTAFEENDYESVRYILKHPRMKITENVGRMSDVHLEIFVKHLLEFSKHSK